MRKGRPDGVESWTFKRCAGQNLVWAIFGNDRDGVTPWFRDEQWSFWRWWIRNRFSNFKWYIIGYAWWIEGNPMAAWTTDHLVYHWTSMRKYFVFYWVKPRRRCRLYWRPFVWLRIWKIAAWWGWKRRGQFASSIKKI